MCCQEEKTVTVLFVVMHCYQVPLSVPFHLGSICTRVVPVAFRICLPTPLGGTPVLHTVKFFFFFFQPKPAIGDSDVLETFHKFVIKHKKPYLTDKDGMF